MEIVYFVLEMLWYIFFEGFYTKKGYWEEGLHCTLLNSSIFIFVPIYLFLVIHQWHYINHDLLVGSVIEGALHVGFGGRINFWLIELNLFATRGCFFQEGNEVKMRMSVDAAYERAIETVFSWIQREVNRSKTQVIFRTYAPVHFRFVPMIS